MGLALDHCFNDGSKPNLKSDVTALPSSRRHSILFKGSVQRKLRGVETGVNRWVWASDRGAGHYFIV
jgi:hypothetical protein